MKRSLIVLIVLFFSAAVFSQNSDADKVLGTWQTGSGKGRIQITRYGNKYGGKVVWLLNPNDAQGKIKLDNKNPDVSKRKNTIMGLSNLLGFEYVGKGKYEDGTIYDPENGKTYKCVMHLENENTLKVRGYVGITLIGRTDIWTRVK